MLDQEITLHDERVVVFKPVTLRILREAGRIERSIEDEDAHFDSQMHMIFECARDDTGERFFVDKDGIADLPLADTKLLIAAVDKSIAGDEDKDDPLPS